MPFTKKLEVSGGLDIASQLPTAHRRTRLGQAASDPDEQKEDLAD
jgi:hypothetical protein